MTLRIVFLLAVCLVSVHTSLAQIAVTGGRHNLQGGGIAESVQLSKDFKAGKTHISGTLGHVRTTDPIGQASRRTDVGVGFNRPGLSGGLSKTWNHGQSHGISAQVSKDLYSSDKLKLTGNLGHDITKSRGMTSRQTSAGLDLVPKKGPAVSFSRTWDHGRGRLDSFRASQDLFKSSNGWSGNVYGGHTRGNFGGQKIRNNEFGIGIKRTF